jgi:chromatin remodeling complex protein RSC6
MARKINKAFMKPLQPSAALAEVVGSKPLPRTEVTKKLWAYIKKSRSARSKKQAQHQRRRNLEKSFRWQVSSQYV